MSGGQPSAGPPKSKTPDFTWRSFLAEAGIKAPFVDQYAAMLHKNNVDESLLADLSPEYLKSIGIKSIGHQIRILKRIKMTKGTKASKSPRPMSTFRQFSRSPSPFTRAFTVPRRQGSYTNRLLTRSLFAALPSWNTAAVSSTSSRNSGTVKAPSELLSLGSWGSSSFMS